MSLIPLVLLNREGAIVLLARTVHEKAKETPIIDGCILGQTQKTEHA